METRPNNPPVFTVILIVVFSLALLLFFAVVVNFAQQPASQPTLTSRPLLFTYTSPPSPVATHTSTITLTPRPTWTLRPSSTVTETPLPTATTTSTLARTLTPASPANFNDRYELKPWDLSQQVQTVELLQANAILSHTDASFRALAIAEGEASLRFPAALDAVAWSWDRAYNLLRIDDTLGIALYSQSIQSILSSGQVRVDDLPAWFAENESRLALNLYPLPALPGELSRGLIELVGEGSAFLWLVETPLEVTVHPLQNDLDFDQAHVNAFMYADLTGDVTPELVIYRQSTPGLTQLTIPLIFNLSVSPPVMLPVEHQVPVDFGFEPQLDVEIASRDNGKPSLRTSYLLLPACPTYVSREYTWNDSEFTASPLTYELVPLPESLAFCDLVLEAAFSSWDPLAALVVAAPLLESWPPQVDIDGHPYPMDTLDQLRYRLGLASALAGQISQAVEYLDLVVDSPTTSASRWIEPARQFLQAYLRPEDIYTACRTADLCNMRDALRLLVHLSGLNEPAQVWSYLKNHGVTITSSGLFDFDLDGQDERWLIIQPSPDAKLEFWILSETVSAVQAVFVEVFEAGKSLPYYHQPAGDIPVVQFELHKGIVFNRLDDTRETYITWVDVEYSRPTLILDGMIDAQNALFQGADPRLVLDNLLELFNSPRFKGDCIAFRICDQFHYLLALVNDLLGEQGSAIDEYLWVWRNYPRSPYATMARLKLDYFPLPTYTFTPIPSRTPTRTRTPTFTATATSTP